MPKYTSMYSEEFPYPQKFLDDDPHDYATLNPKHDASYKMVRPAVKTAYFYQDGDIDARGIRIAIHPNRYRSLEALLGELTEKMPKLGCGARAIFTPKGRNKVQSLADLENNGHYICSERTARPRGISSDRLTPVWRNGMRDPSFRVQDFERRHLPPSKVTVRDLSSEFTHGRSTLSRSNSNTSSGSPQISQLPPLPPLGKPAQPVMNSSYTTAWGTNQLRQAKRIYVRLRGDQKNQKTVVIRRRYVKNIEQVLQELSELFQVPIRKLYTVAGHQIETIDDLIKGPNEIIATGNERYSPKFVFNDNVITPIARSRSEQRLRSHGTPGKVYHVDKSRNRSVGRPSSTAGSWKILITSGVVDADTGDTYLAACTSNILLTVCDRYHGSQPIVLRSAYVKTLPEPHVEVRHEKGNCPNGTPPAIPENVPFNPGRTDRFDAVLTSVRDIYKIRLSHDGTGSYPEWFPKEVRMQPLGADHVLPTPAPSVDEKRHSRLVKPPADSIRGVQPELVFPCNKWLSRVKGEGSLTVEVAAPGTQLLNGRSTVGSNARILTVDPLSLAAFGDRAPAIRYEIHVTTGNLWDAGTKAQISVQLQGDRGDSGRRVLYTPGVDQSMNFIRGQTSVFGIDAVFLGRLRRMTVWIEAGERTNTTWYLERIVVREILLPFSPSQRRISDRTSQSLHEAQSSIHSVQLGVSCFPCHQWLGLTPKPGTPEIQLTATAGSGAVAADMLERSVSSNQEETWWQLEQWKFRPGNAVVFYSYATGARMRVVEGGRIEAHQLEEKNTVDTSGTVFIVTSPSTELRHGRILKPRPAPNSLASHGHIHLNNSVMLQHDVERFNESNTVNKIRQFCCAQDAWLRLSLNPTAGLCVTDERLNSSRSVNETCQFRIRARPEHWVVLEAVRPSSSRSATHVYIGPDGYVVSGAAGPLSIPGKLLMVHAKGCLRDETILWLCTSSQQTLAALLCDKSTDQSDPQQIRSQSEWSFKLRGTGLRNKEAYWRVQKVSKGIRQFESVAWPGHYLRVVNGKVDAMGSGGTDCLFHIVRQRSKGYIQLSPSSSPSALVGMEEDGEVALFAASDTDHTRFYPEVITYGIHKPTSEAPTVKKAQKNVPLKSDVTEDEQVVTEDSVKGSWPLQMTESAISSIVNEEDLDATPDSAQVANLKDMSPNDWKVSITTVYAAKNCSVLLVVYGFQSNSGPILIGQTGDEKELFQENSTDNFMVVLEKLGPIFKVRLELSPLEPHEAVEWEILEVVLENFVSGEKISFDFSGRPFGRTSTFCQLAREQVMDDLAIEIKSCIAKGLQSVDPADTTKLDVVFYRVVLELRSDAGWTESQSSFEPHVSLMGRYGDCGRRIIPLIAPTSMRHMENEDLWIYESYLEAVYLGELTRCLLGPVDVTSQMDDARTGPFCTRVIIWDPVSEQYFHFQANTWLLGKRTGQIHELHLHISEIRTRECDGELEAEIKQIDEEQTDMQGDEKEESLQSQVVPDEDDDEEKEELMNLIYEDAHQLISAIVEKAEQNLATFQRWRTQ